MKKIFKIASLSLIAVTMLIMSPPLASTVNAQDTTIDVSAPTIRILT